MRTKDKRAWVSAVCLGFLSAVSRAPAQGLIPAFPIERDALTIERPARPSTYFDKAGRRFAILGEEGGSFEAWAYPLKIVRNFELSFLLKGGTRTIPARDLVRSVEVTPAATVITYVWQTFTAREIIVTASDEPGAVVLIGLDASEPVTVVARFLPVLQPMWPAGLGGQYASWDDGLKAYLISEPTRRNHGFVGSPAGRGISYTPAHMLADTPSEFVIEVAKPAEVRGRFIPIVLAGGKGRREDVRRVYERIASDPRRVYLEALDHYRKLASRALRVETPVSKLDLALGWAAVSLDNLRVTNPDLGSGLVAGLGASGAGGRPGFGWFFGTDAYLNSLSLSGLGDFEAAREAIAFTRKWQRSDGKMAHELSQAAGYVDWFNDYPYGYIHADTTPFYIAAVHDYYAASGDLDFVRESWLPLRRAYDWCLAADADGDGLMDNSRAGLGALEFGSLTGIQTDIYLAAVWARAAFGMSELARAMGEDKFAGKAASDHKKALAALEGRLWDAAAGRYSYGFTKDGKLVKELTPWCAVPLFWGMAPEARAVKTLEKLCPADLMTDWGVRILSSASPLYEPLNYNYGAVWPFLGGYTAAALYQYGLAIPAYELVLANAGHLFDNAAGAATELFSGALHTWPGEAVAHQGFSATGFVLPFVRGLLGLGGDAARREVVFAPTFPGDWRRVAIDRFRVGGETLSFRWQREEGRIRVEVASREGSGLKLRFAPALAAGTVVRKASLNGRTLPSRTAESGSVVRPAVEVPLSGSDTIEIDIEPAFELLPPEIESRVGDSDAGLKFVRQELRAGTLTAAVEGLAGREYEVRVLHPERALSVTGAELRGDRLLVRMPAGQDPGFFSRQDILIKLK